MLDDASLHALAQMLQQRPVVTPVALNTHEAATYLGLSAPTLHRWRAAGTGPRYAKLGGAVVYRVVDLDSWLESKLVDDVPSAQQTRQAQRTRSRTARPTR